MSETPLPPASPESTTPAGLPAAEEAPSPELPTLPRGRGRGRPKADVYRVNVTVPGILHPSIQTRWAEFHYESFSPFAVELVCYDLRQRFPHIVTGPIGQWEQSMLDGVDRQIVAHYRPHTPRDKGLMLRLLHRLQSGTTEPIDQDDLLFVPAPPGPQLMAVREHVYFPAKLQAIIEVRRAELGYEWLSNYVTSLIRYDLMLGGPHRYFNGYDTDPEILASLDAETLETFQLQERQRIRLEDLIEEAAGRTMKEEERVAEMQRIVEALRVMALPRGRGVK